MPPLHCTDRPEHVARGPVSNRCTVKRFIRESYVSVHNMRVFVCVIALPLTHPSRVHTVGTSVESKSGTRPLYGTALPGDLVVNPEIWQV